ncbi:PREDICTED: embryonic polyadenylate-binding protein 2 [Miniopterus natalensis]|uniref:embryonic polyadenylate-binding protein 2 n=1 Tax=Miniopterus natalensis TaxID=291302 RepID=UPI0007A718EE|nr:PREDICTED: embryonic polyadenylate-binding protein 2 [Miniopterus natalensis]
MWPFCNHALFSPPTEAWLQRASSDPEAQGWGAWSWTEKTPLEPECGDKKEEEETGKAGDNEEDAGSPLFLLEREDLAEHSVPDQELEAIKLKLWAMEQAQGLELPRAQGQAEKEEAARSVLAEQVLNPKTTGCPCSGIPMEKVEMDRRSVYVGNVDYGVTAEELEAYFNICGDVQRVTILRDKFSGHPKGYAYIEFATESSAQAAVELDESIFRGRVIKVLPKRTNLPGITFTVPGALQGHPGAKGAPFSHSRSLQGGAHIIPRGWNRGRGRVSLWYSPYCRRNLILRVGLATEMRPYATPYLFSHGGAPQEQPVEQRGWPTSPSEASSLAAPGLQALWAPATQLPLPLHACADNSSLLSGP